MTRNIELAIPLMTFNHNTVFQSHCSLVMFNTFGVYKETTLATRVSQATQIKYCYPSAKQMLHIYREISIINSFSIECVNYILNILLIT